MEGSNIETTGKYQITLEAGRNEFARMMQKYQFDEASLEKLKDYYGYFWNRCKDVNVPRLHKNVFLFCVSDIVGRNIYETCTNCLLDQKLIDRKEDIGYTYLVTKQDIDEIKEIYSEDAVAVSSIILKKEKFQSVIAAMPEKGEAKEELYETGAALFYREFRDHITSRVSEADVVYWELRKILEEKQKFTDEFYIELQKYIQTVYPKREIENLQKFLQDACERIWNKYYGRYEAGLPGGVDCVPDYQMERIQSIKNPELIVKIEDIKDEELTSDIKNVLLLSMSTFPYSHKLKLNHYQYIDKKGIYEVSGCGQLEPVPKLLQKKLEISDEKLELILIMASDEAQKEETIEIEETDDMSGGKTIWKLKKGNAVDFFKEQINKENTNIKYKVFTNSSSDLPDSMEEVVRFIRKIKKCNPNFKLYLDIHGGLRQAQLSVDAVINLLRMEDIRIEEAFSIAGIKSDGESSPIINVTEDMRIFDFVSGMNEFINYGRSKGLENFFEDKNEIVNKVQKIARAIQICDIDKFVLALDGIKKCMDGINEDKKDVNQKLLNIFIGNMKADYGKLLEPDRTDLDLLKWCRDKGFYQQALTVIESRIPSFLDGKVFGFEVKSGDKNEKLSQKEIINKVKTQDWQRDSNFLFEKFGFFKVIKTKKLKDGCMKTENIYIELNMGTAKDFWKNTEEYWKDEQKKRYEFFIKTIKCGRENYCEVKLNFLKEFTKEEEKKFNIFMQLHMALKNQRNLANHAVSDDPKRIEPVQIFNAINAYIEMVEHFVS